MGECIRAMVLQEVPLGLHNQMTRPSSRHSLTVNFDDDLELPAPKRLKRLESTDGGDSYEIQEHGQGGGRVNQKDEVRDSEADSDTDDVVSSTNTKQTDLETALPPLKADKEAIAEYEAFRASQNDIPSDSEGRLNQRKWVKGKSSIYVDAFNLALETVLGDEGHLFDEAEMEIFEQWRGLSYEAQYL